MLFNCEIAQVTLPYKYPNTFVIKSDDSYLNWDSVGLTPNVDPPKVNLVFSS